MHLPNKTITKFHQVFRLKILHTYKITLYQQGEQQFSGTRAHAPQVHVPTRRWTNSPSSLWLTSGHAEETQQIGSQLRSLYQRPSSNRL